MKKFMLLIALSVIMITGSAITTIANTSVSIEVSDIEIYKD